MSFQFDRSYIYAPDASLDIKDWRFSQDLRQFFPETDGRGKYGNNTIGDILKKRGVINRQGSVDCEYSCTYAYFNSERAALAFLKRLNAMPEVKNYVEPKRPPAKGIYMSVDWMLFPFVVKRAHQDLLGQPGYNKKKWMEAESQPRQRLARLRMLKRRHWVMKFLIEISADTQEGLVKMGEAALSRLRSGGSSLSAGFSGVGDVRLRAASTADEFQFLRQVDEAQAADSAVAVRTGKTRAAGGGGYYW